MKTKVIGIGAGGHAKVVLEILRLSGRFEVEGLLDVNTALWHKTVSGVVVLGGDDLLAELRTKGLRHVFIGVGSTRQMEPRRRLYLTARNLGLRAVNAIHPFSSVSAGVAMGDGVTIMAGAIINVDARLGENVIVNSGAVVEHDCTIGDHVHIATGAKLASTVQIGSGTHVGAGACIRQCVIVGQNVTVGAGAVVVHDVPDNVIVVGVPARPMADTTGS